jgi:hypothetical protein
VAANLEAIRAAFREGTFDFTSTGYPKMRKLGLRVEHLKTVIVDDAPEILEDYPGDERGPACLVLGWADLVRPLHVVIGYGDEPGAYIDVITVYEPDEHQWYNHRKRR